MSIYVTTTDGGTVDYPEANDANCEDGHVLHVYGPNGVVGIHARDTWTVARRRIVDSEAINVRLIASEVTGDAVRKLAEQLAWLQRGQQ